MALQSIAFQASDVLGDDTAVSHLDPLPVAANLHVGGIATRAWQDGTLFAGSQYLDWVARGFVYTVNGGVGTTPITFAGAYDADAPDLFIHVPREYAIIPLRIDVIFEAVGTESTMEILALASPQGDSTATGTAVIPRNHRIGLPADTTLTATAAVDAAGITDPNVAGSFEFWRSQRPLTDTVATTENDRNPLVFTWRALEDGPPPIISGAAGSASLSVYAASQAGTGFIAVTYARFPASYFGA